MAGKSWQDVEAEIRHIVTGSSEKFSRDTLVQVSDFVMLARECCPVPDNVGKGYRATLSLYWAAESFEVEIFADRLELYRFFGGRTEIRHVEHVAGSPFPQELAAELPKRGAGDRLTP